MSNGRSKTAKTHSKKKNKDAVIQKLEKVVSAYWVFMELATKYKLDTIDSASRHWGISKKEARILLECDLTMITYEDYISYTADLCFFGFTLEKEARSIRK